MRPAGYKTIYIGYLSALYVNWFIPIETRTPHL